MFATSIPFRVDSFVSQREESVNDSESGMQILESLASELEQAGFDRRRIIHVQIAFTEAFLNALRHGNQDDPRKGVHIRYRIDFTGLWLSIEDEGLGFDPNAVIDPTLSEHLDRPGGRGLLLMKSLMNHVEFNERGNHVVMRLLKVAA